MFATFSEGYSFCMYHMQKVLSITHLSSKITIERPMRSFAIGNERQESISDIEHMAQAHWLCSASVGASKSLNRAYNKSIKQVGRMRKLTFLSFNSN